jgi:hypothetical protein
MHFLIIVAKFKSKTFESLIPKFQSLYQIDLNYLNMCSLFVDHNLTPGVYFLQSIIITTKKQFLKIKLMLF